MHIYSAGFKYDQHHFRNFDNIRMHNLECKQTFFCAEMFFSDDFMETIETHEVVE